LLPRFDRVVEVSVLRVGWGSLRACLSRAHRLPVSRGRWRRV